MGLVPFDRKACVAAKEREREWTLSLSLNFFFSIFACSLALNICTRPSFRIRVWYGGRESPARLFTNRTKQMENVIYWAGYVSTQLPMPFIWRCLPYKPWKWSELIFKDSATVDFDEVNINIEHFGTIFKTTQRTEPRYIQLMSTCDLCPSLNPCESTVHLIISQQALVLYMRLGIEVHFFLCSSTVSEDQKKGEYV